MFLRGWLGFLALIVAVAIVRAFDKPNIGGFLGCRFSRTVCLEDERCVDDHLFGNCQSVLRRADGYQYNLDSTSLQTLEAEIAKLIRAKFTWSDFYTQCVLGNILLAYRRGQDTYDPDWCDKPEVPLSDRLDSEALRTLQKYFEDYYDAVNSDNGVNNFESDDVVDVESPYEFDPYASEKEKKDELISVHKYFAPKRSEDEYVDDRDLGSDLDLLLGRLGEDDINALRYYLRDLDDGGLDVSVPAQDESDIVREAEERYLEDNLVNPEAVAQFGNPEAGAQLGYTIEEDGSFYPSEGPYEGEVESDSLPVESSELPQSDRELIPGNGPMLTPPEAKLLDDLLNEKVDVRSLPDDEIQRMLGVVEQMMVGMERNQEEMGATDDEITEDKRAPEKRKYTIAMKKEQLNSEVLQNPGGNSQVHVQVAPVGEKRAPPPPDDAAEVGDGHDHTWDESGHNPHTSGPKLEIVNGNYGYITVNPKTDDIDQASNFVAELERVSGLHAGDVAVEGVKDGDISFKVNQNEMGLNASLVANIAVLKSAQLKNRTGFTVISAGYGKDNKVSVEEATHYNGPKYFVITFVLCGVIAGCVLAVVALYVVRRHSRSKQKLMQLAGQGDGLEASKDYQDLCRQRMQSKSSEKPEPINVAARVGSVSTSEAAVRSPSSRSSTSSWSEEPVTSNMDISTGHIVLSYMEDHLKNRDRLDQEWESLCAYDAEPNSIATAMDPSNMRKTRYSDVLPYDHSRVNLTASTNVSGSDYINASTITDHDPRNPAYIASQGPLPHTVADFWQMVWEQGSVVIVMLTKLTENGVAMCHRYWPEEGSDLYHIYEVHLVSEHIWCDDYLVRSFYLKNLQTNETRTVTQFHFLTWPDLGVPSSVKALLDFRRKVNKSYRGRSCPIVVHCSDGSGRTGTYMLIDMVLNRMSKGAKEIDIAATLEHIRDQRMNMVKTKEQFEFALASVAEEVHAILKALPQ